MLDKHKNPNGTYDGVGVMSEVTGLPRGDVLGIWERVKANHALLSACPVHAFEPPTKAAPKKRRCSACGGVVDVIEAEWYERGFRAGATGRHDG